MLLNTTAPGATTPGFAFQVTFRTGTEPISVTAADVNGDGKPDVIVANNSGQTLSVLLNETPPGAAVASFGTPQAFATDGFPYLVTTADVNGDGKPDLIAANLTLTGTTVSVLINTTAPGATTPSFAPQVPFAAGTVNTPQGWQQGTLTGTANQTSSLQTGMYWFSSTPPCQARLPPASPPPNRSWTPVPPSR